jgi:branched-chain amino acid aminotransferase
MAVNPNEPLAWLNGHFISCSQAKLPVSDMGLVHGATVTEMTRSFQQRWFRLDDHLRRLETSLKTVGWQIPYTVPELSVISERIRTHNAPLLPPGHELGLIHFVTAGQNLTYLGAARRDECRRPTVCCHSFPLPCELWAEKYTNGQHLVIPSIRQIPIECLSTGMKHRSRLHWVLADAQARDRDPQANAILLDNKGDLTETSGGNFFLVKAGTIFTPRPKNILSGISRYVVFLLAEDLGIPIVVTDLHPSELRQASEAFTSSTPYCLLPVTKFDGKTVGAGEPGPIFRRLLSAWSKLVNCEIDVDMRKIAAERMLHG